MNRILVPLGVRIGLLTAASALLPAAPMSLEIKIDTSALMSSLTGPYSLEFQLTDGDAVSNQIVDIMNFDFGGGMPLSSPVLQGGATGSLGSSVRLTDTDFLNSFYQQFQAGAFLSFIVRFDPVEGGPFPDQFSLSILNGDLVELPTNGLGNELFSVDFRLPLVLNTFSGVQSGGDPVLPAPSVTPASTVPEPGTLALLGCSALILCGIRQLRPRNPNAIRERSNG